MIDTGLPTTAGGCGTIGPRTIASVTDGTRNTILFVEHCQSKLIDITSEFECKGWWSGGKYVDSSISSFYPPNVPPLPGYATKTTRWKNSDGCDCHSEGGSSYQAIPAQSMHPGGVNVASSDGSVHFIKNSINSWNYNPPNITRSTGNYTAPCFPFSARGNGV
jgi:hypothetical protein